MDFVQVGSTNPEMIRLLADMSRSDVWEAFLEKYSPLIKNYCGQRHLSVEDSTEIYSRVMVILVSIFADPKRRVNVSFRGYLCKVVSTEIGKLLLEKQKELTVSNADQKLVDSLIAYQFEFDREMYEFEQTIIWRIEVLTIIFESVRTRVKKQTWQAFWDVTVKGKEYSEVANSRGIEYLTVIQANRRVMQMIHQEAAQKCINPRTG